MQWMWSVTGRGALHCSNLQQSPGTTAFLDHSGALATCCIPRKQKSTGVLPVDTCFGQAEKYLSARVSTCHQQSIDKRKSIDLQLDCSSRRYSAGAVLQIMLFGIMAIQIKRKAPNCHTILEVVRLRWGKAAHLVGILFPHLKTLTSLPSLLPSTHSSHSL